jgi:hypothetical protein
METNTLAYFSEASVTLYLMSRVKSLPGGKIFYPLLIKIFLLGTNALAYFTLPWSIRLPSLNILHTPI